MWPRTQVRTRLHPDSPPLSHLPTRPCPTTAATPFGRAQAKRQAEQAAANGGVPPPGYVKLNEEGEDGEVKPPQEVRRCRRSIGMERMQGTTSTPPHPRQHSRRTTQCATPTAPLNESPTQ